MRFLRILVVLVLLVISFLLFPVSSFACTCVEPLSAKQEFDRSTAVFRGEVKEIRKANNHEYGLKVLLKVSEVWKGIDESEVIIRTAKDEAACGFEFQIGEEYLVYAGTNDAFQNDNLMTGICDRTSQVVVQQAQEDMKVLGQGVAPVELVENKSLPSIVVAGLWVGLGVFVLIVFLALRYSKKTDS